MADKKKISFRKYANLQAMEHMKAIEGKAPDFFPVIEIVRRKDNQVTAFPLLLEQMVTKMPKPEPLYSEFTFEACPITSNN